MLSRQLADQTRRRLDSARRILVLTGAGISAESGVPTFRGAGGLWGRYRPEEIATPEAFARDPRLVWQWYASRRDQTLACAPNAAHLAIARWMASRAGVTLVTQNVDGLHERASMIVEPDRSRACAPIRLHGSLFRVRCTGCGVEDDHLEPITVGAEGALPSCQRCGATLRPAVVWFGELLPMDAMRRALEAARTAEACLVVGTAGAVYPAAGLAFEARARGATLIVVDPGETAFDDDADIRIRAAAAAAVPLVCIPADPPE
ncbi:MAG: NAD-dependent deacetylase [Gemmatimonadales bacterium]